MTSAVDITIVRGATSTAVRGWVAQAFSTEAEQQPARVYIEGVEKGLLERGDILTASGVAYVTEQVNWWHPDSIEATLADLDMPDTCIIHRASGGTLDPVNHQSSTTWASVWTGSCRAWYRFAGRTTVGGGQSSALQLEIALPMDAPDPLIGERITITQATFEPRLQGEVVFVSAVPVGSQSVLRRVSAERPAGLDRR